MYVAISFAPENAYSISSRATRNAPQIETISVSMSTTCATMFFADEIQSA